jgi:prevent-host-death family protein
VTESGGRDGRGRNSPIAAFDTSLASGLQIDWSIRPIQSAVSIMREIQASEAKTHLPQLLDEVERGETLLITRHGRAIARIVPEAQQRQTEVDQAIEEIKALRTRIGKVTLKEIISARHEGHKY